MESREYNYTLTDLLCLSRFENVIRPMQISCSKAFTEWAEREIMAGSESDPLLILASLNLDDAPDDDDVQLYLNRYLAEQGIRRPGRTFEALIWLRIQIQQLIRSATVEDICDNLSFFALYHIGCDNYFVEKARKHFSWLYYYLVEDYGGEYPSPASEMSDADLPTFKAKNFAAMERKLFNDDWLRLLANDKEENTPP